MTIEFIKFIPTVHFLKLIALRLFDLKEETDEFVGKVKEPTSKVDQDNILETLSKTVIDPIEEEEAPEISINYSLDADYDLSANISETSLKIALEFIEEGKDPYLEESESAVGRNSLKIKYKNNTKPLTLFGGKDVTLIKQREDGDTYFYLTFKNTLDTLESLLIGGTEVKVRFGYTLDTFEINSQKNGSIFTKTLSQLSPFLLGSGVTLEKVDPVIRELSEDVNLLSLQFVTDGDNDLVINNIKVNFCIIYKGLEILLFSQFDDIEGPEDEDGEEPEPERLLFLDSIAIHSKFEYSKKQSSFLVYPTATLGTEEESDLEIKGNYRIRGGGGGGGYIVSPEWETVRVLDISGMSIISHTTGDELWYYLLDQGGYTHEYAPIPNWDLMKTLSWRQNTLSGLDRFKYIPFFRIDYEGTLITGNQRVERIDENLYPDPDNFPNIWPVQESRFIGGLKVVRDLYMVSGSGSSGQEWGYCLIFTVHYNRAEQAVVSAAQLTSEIDTLYPEDRCPYAYPGNIYGYPYDEYEDWTNGMRPKKRKSNGIYYSRFDTY